MTTRKKKTDDAIDPKDATGAQAEVIEETTGEADEVVEYPTFTIEVNGEDIEIEDRWTREAAPAGMMFVFHERYAQKYIPSVLEQLIGEDQVFKLMDLGLSVDEFRDVFSAWGERRQGK
ncbi:hypothetical protein HMPREF2822_12400 [Corynebacterium sp. HMSC062E11]|uniref:hypothetical protein n=1 Tax=Corynebacterium sp. HMSC062E11 TaxID=1739326 RepID=UPI0008A58C92|nr:hypothetical protein [Corynebacterium sp. HMSC062E11]OFK27236.1 hypothetical protein HMPREF2822_12400 [Corynebacterium sp. HMSC062E11]